MRVLQVFNEDGEEVVKIQNDSHVLPTKFVQEMLFAFEESKKGRTQDNVIMGWKIYADAHLDRMEEFSVKFKTI